MLYKLRRFISVLVLIVTVLNGIALTSPKAYANVTPTQVNDAVKKFADAVGKFSEEAAKEEDTLVNFCNRLGGVVSVAAGVIGVLQMIGVIKDPKMIMLEKILDAVRNFQTMLDGMNKNLNKIVQELINIQVAQQEIARNNKATQMSKYWDDFNTNYTEKLALYVNEYQAKINSGIEEWWKQASHEGVYVLMAKKYDEKNALTYSKQDYNAGLPTKSEVSGDIISTEWSIGIPADCMPNTSTAEFNINTYRDDFKKLMITALDNAIRNNKLASDCGASVKSEYNTSSKDIMLESYADNVLNTMTYKIACRVMHDNTTWVTQVVTIYMQYCDNILLQNSGVNAFLNYIYQTHAFEGEVKDQITKFLDAMVAQAGFYGEFALTCAGQDSLQTLETKEKIREYFVNTVLSLSNRKTKALTGHDNYCYIIGRLVEEPQSPILDSEVCVKKTTTRNFKGCNVSSWSPTNFPEYIVDSVYLPIIYNQYTVLSEDTKSFAEYLFKYKAKNNTQNKRYLTRFDVQTFALSEGIPMYAEGGIIEGSGRYFSHGGLYNINVGTDPGLTPDYYHVHDKIIGDLFDTSNGSQTVNTLILARAFYGETHWYWIYDEAWAFATGGVTKYTKDGSGYDQVVKFYQVVDVLGSMPYHNFDDDTNDQENPFFAFDQVSLTPGVSDFDGILYENTSKDITDILLESESFTYTGDPIEPAVMVLCSDDIVSEDGYTVTYINNDIDSGDAVVRVEGKGDYSGIITRRFRINSASDSDSDSPINYSTGSSGGCNSISGLGLALGLVFVFKKLRRR